MNWYIVEDGGRLTVVDGGLPGAKRTLGSDLGSLGFQLSDIDALILTHSDADHTGLAAVLHDAGARVLVHSDDDATLRKPGPKSGDGKPLNMVPHMWRPSFWRLAAAMLSNGGGRPPKFEGAETFEGGVLDLPGARA